MIQFLHLHTRNTYTFIFTRKLIQWKIKTTKLACWQEKRGTKLIHFNCLMLPRSHAIYEQYVKWKIIAHTHTHARYKQCAWVCMCIARSGELAFAEHHMLSTTIIHTISIITRSTHIDFIVYHRINMKCGKMENREQFFRLNIN